MEKDSRIIVPETTVFRVKMGGPETTDQITAALGFPFQEWITQENLPLTPAKTPWEDEIEIIDPGRDFTEKEGFVILAEAKLVRPTHEHALRFAEQYGKATTSEKKPYIIFLHEPWQAPRRDRYVLDLDRSPDYRGLYLGWADRRFDARCVLAGVRPRKQSSGA